MVDNRGKWLIVLGVILLVNIFTGIHYYGQGKRLGEINEAIKQLNTSLDIADSIIHSDSLMLSIARKQSDSIGIRRDVLRSHIHIIHDTTYVEPDSGSDDIEQVISDNPQIAGLIMTDDSTINALRRINKDQDKSISDLYSERVLLKNKISVLESNQHVPRGSWGFQAGAGYCTSPKGGNIPCVYLGLGYSVRL